MPEWVFLGWTSTKQRIKCIAQGHKIVPPVLFLFGLILYVPSTIFQLNRDGSSWVEPLLSWDKCVLLKDHNTVKPVRLEPTASWSRVKHSTTEPLLSQNKHEAVWCPNISVNSLHAGKYSCLCCRLLNFLKTIFLRKNPLWNTIRVPNS